MKTDLHPTYSEATVLCSCGNTFTTRSTKEDLRVEICSNCHPFYTGKQKFVDTGGRLQRFQQKLDRTGAADAGAAGGKKKKARSVSFAPAVDPKVLKAKADRAAAKARADADAKKAAEEKAKAEAAERKKAAAEAEAAAKIAAAEAPADDAPAEAPAEAATEAPAGEATEAGSEG